MTNRRPPPADNRSMRLRVAWMYYGHQITQARIAEMLNISRSTVIRILEQVRDRREVRFAIDLDREIYTEIEVALRLRLGLNDVQIVPSGTTPETTARGVGLALGQYLSGVVMDGMTLGVGWGRTLTHALDAFTPPSRSDVSVVSLLGGLIHAGEVNPVEFAWRLSDIMNARCHFFPAPLIVDSPETKRRLIENCGLSDLFDLASDLDIAVVSVGETNNRTTSLSRQFLTDEELGRLIAAGAVADVMCNFIDAQGDKIDDPLMDRVMAVDVNWLRGAGSRVLASGGVERAEAILAAIRAIKATTLITDEGAASRILKLLDNG